MSDLTKDNLLKSVLDTVSKETLIDYMIYILPPTEKEALIKLYNKGVVDGALEELGGK